MIINDIVQSKKMTKYRLAKQSNVPYATLSDICSGKTSLAKCSAETVYRLVKTLNVSMEALIEPSLEPRPSFELFKSNVCHRLKALGDIDFLIECLNSNEIETYFRKKQYPESLYLLATVDYLSRLNGLPLCDKYAPIRKAKLKSPLFPSGVLALAATTGDEHVTQDAIRNAIPEFMRFNIVESEIRNVN